MKQKLLKTLLLLCALVGVTSSVWADDYALVTSSPGDWSGDYVVVNSLNQSASTFIADGTVTGNTFSTADAVKTLTNAGISYDDTNKKLTGVTDSYVLHIEPSGNAGKYYITLKGANSTIYLIANSSTGSSSISTATVTTNAEWTLGLGASGNAYLIGKSGRYVGWNSTYFRAYASTNKDTYKCYLFKKVPTTYSVTFNAGAGTFVGNSDFASTSNSKAAGTYTLPSATPTVGYDFTGWSDGTNTYSAGDSYTVSAAVTFTAQYTASSSPACTIDPTSYDFGNVAVDASPTKTFTITTANLTGDVTLAIDGDDEFSVEPTTIDQDATSTEVTITFNPTSTGYYAAFLTANGGGITNDELAALEGTGAESYTITFNPGNGTCATATESGVSGTKIDLPTASPSAVCSEAGYKFVGWATSSVTSTTTAPTLLTGDYTITGSTTLYAVYKLDESDLVLAKTTYIFKDLASANSWTSGTAYTSVEISPITLVANGGGNNGKYYSSDYSWRMYNGGSVSITSAAGNIKAVTSSPSKSFAISGKSASLSVSATTNFTSIEVSYYKPIYATSPVLVIPTPIIEGTTPFYGTTEVTITCGTAGATIQYSTDNGVNWTNYSAPFELDATTTVKAKATKTDWEDSEVASKTFTEIVPLTVTEALADIDALENNGQITEQYVKGYVSTTGSLSSGKITYSISVDGNATNELTVYSGKGLNNVNFEAASDIALGDEVVVYGTLKKFESGGDITPEFIGGNYLFYKNRHPAPTFTLDPTSKTLDAYSHETVDVTLTTNTDGVISCESDNEDVATVALKSAGVYTITAQTSGTATITIKSAVSENYAPASATVAITVTDDRADAGISFANATVTKTWGESFTGQELTNTNSVAVTWSSTDEAVATVDNTGAVTVLKAGETDIKATFDGNATYKAAVASYTLTVNKAEADISYAVTSFDVMLDDDSFVVPTLNNPNSLTVTYESNNTTIADVNASTGAYELVTTAAGTAKITATFAGNDWYKSGSANYTINIYDPSVKGGKYNPYTVAEVIAMAPASTSIPADGQSDIYVTGYIVGEYRNANQSTTTVLQSSFTTDANIAIADDPTTTALASSIPVNLTKTADKNEFGNKTNSGKTMGYKVLVKGDALQYFGAPGFKNIDEISAVTVPVTVTAVGYATYASNYNLDFTGKSIHAYIATTKGDGTGVDFAQINKVPAGTGVLLYKDGGTTESIPVFDGTGADATTGNKFVRGEGAAVATDGGTTWNYILNNKGGNLGFYRAAGQTVAANRAYISILKSETPSGVKEFIALPGSEETAVEAVKAEAENGVIFNLAGQRVQKLQRGINIVNGRKVVVK